ncbi:Rcs stress response system protein RcsF [Shewanella gaetbuli]
MHSRVSNVLTITSLSLVLTACAGDYAFNTNLDSEKINDYFKVGEVTVYEGSNLPKGKFDMLSLVEGESCQEQANDAPSSISDARTQARKKAAELGATGIIIQHCIDINEPDSVCVSRSICSGQAIKSVQVN